MGKKLGKISSLSVISWILIIINCFSSVFLSGFLSGHSGYAGVHMVAVAFNLFDNGPLGLYDLCTELDGTMVYLPYAHHPFLSYFIFGWVKLLPIQAITRLKVVLIIVGVINFSAFRLLKYLYSIKGYSARSFFLSSLCLLTSMNFVDHRNMIGFDSFNFFSAVLMLLALETKHLKKSLRTLIISLLLFLSWYNIVIIAALFVQQYFKKADFELDNRRIFSVLLFTGIVIFILNFLLFTNVSHNLLDIMPRGYGKMSNVGINEVLKILFKTVPIAFLFLLPKNIRVNWYNPWVFSILAFVIIGFNWNIRHPFIFVYLTVFLTVNLFRNVALSRNNIVVLILLSFSVQIYYFRIDYFESQRTYSMFFDSLPNHESGLKVSPRLVESWGNDWNWGRYVYIKAND